MSSPDDRFPNQRQQDSPNDQTFDGRKLSDTICIVPFVSLSVHANGYVTRCQMSERKMGSFNSNQTILDAWNSQDMQGLRQSMKDGQWDPGCNSCFNKENINIKSKRQHWSDLGIVKDLWMDRKTFASNSRSDIFHIDVAFSNFCNYKCRMCTSGYSSRWLADEQKLVELGLAAGTGGFVKRGSSEYGVTPGTSMTRENLEILADRMSSVRRIEVLGGEPFLTKEFLDFLELCRDKGLRKDVELMVTTNGSVLNEDLLAKLEPFSYVNLNISADATFPYYEYMRSAGACSWNAFEQNVKMALRFVEKTNSKYSEPKWKINLNGTFQIMNMLNIAEFLGWIEKMFQWDINKPQYNSKHRHSFEHRILMGPRHLSVLNAPVELIEESKAQLETFLESRPYLFEINEQRYINDIRKTLDAAIHHSPKERERQWLMFCWYTQLLDQVRGENLATIDPVLHSHYKKTIDSDFYQKNIEEWKHKVF